MKSHLSFYEIAHNFVVEKFDRSPLDTFFHIFFLTNKIEMTVNLRLYIKISDRYKNEFETRKLEYRVTLSTL